MKLFLLFFLLTSCIGLDIREECARLTPKENCHSEYEYGYSAICNTIGTDGQMKFGSGFCMHNEEHCEPNPKYEYNRAICMNLQN